jgi:regulator of replication initiation timing
MVQPESLMRSEAIALEDECHRLQLLVGELLLKNHQLRCEVAGLREALDAKKNQAKKVQMLPLRFTVSKAIFDGESIG